MKPILRKLNILIILLVALSLFSGCRNNKNRVVHRETVTDTLKKFIQYQEEADKEKAASMIIEDQRETFLNTLSEATRDDMIQSAIAFSELDYSLQELDKDLAVFWSEKGKSYLVLRNDGEDWLIDPAATDEMNN